MAGAESLQPLGVPRLHIHEQLRFSVNVNEASSQNLLIKNPSHELALAFKIKTTNPKRYLVRPNISICWAGETTSVFIQIPAMSSVPADASKCRDKFQVLSIPLSSELSAQLKHASDEERRAKISELFAGDAGKAAAVDKVRATLSFDFWKSAPIPEEGPTATSPCPIPANGAESHGKTPFRSPSAEGLCGSASRAVATPSSAPHTVGVSGGTLFSSLVEAPLTSALEASRAAPATPAAAAGGGGGRSSVEPVAASPLGRRCAHGNAVGEVVQGAPVRCAGADSLDGASAALRALQNANEDLRRQLDESEATRRAMRSQMERALAEYEREKLEHAEQLRGLQAQLAAERARTGAPPATTQPFPAQPLPVPPQYQETANVSYPRVLLIAILSLVAGLYLRPPTSAPPWPANPPTQPPSVPAPWKETHQSTPATWKEANQEAAPRLEEVLDESAEDAHVNPSTS